MAKPTTKSPLAQFTKADQPAPPRIIGASFGEVGTRKTSFWLEGPGPVFVQSLDRGLEGVVQRYQETKDIYFKEYSWSPGQFGDNEDEAQAAAIELRDSIIADLELALPNIRTGLWDKETNIWELFRYAEFGAPNDAPRNYPKLNQRYRHYVNLPKDYDCNFGFIQSMKDKWASKVNKTSGVTQGVNTGLRERQGFGELDELVHVDLRHRFENGTFYIDVGKSRGPGASDIQGETLEGATTFSDFAMLVFPETTEENWK